MPERETELEENYRENGVVYTPSNLADYVAEKTADCFLQDTANSSVSIIDPAAGRGILLESLWNHLEEGGVDRVSIYGMDIDAEAVEICKQNIRETTKSKHNELNIATTNALCPFNKNRQLGIPELKDRFSQPEGFDMMIANPPWGADVSEYEDKLEKSYETLNGQFDTYMLFLEIAMDLVKEDGYFGFIVPDSILNHGKNRVREILLDRTQIKFLARLGEQIFPDINRDTVVMVCKNTPPNPDTETECFRLNKELRDKILEGDATFSEAEQGNTHFVPQKRFLDNEHNKFDIDLKETERETLEKIKSAETTFGEHLKNSRGVELSQSGEVVKCEQCDLWIPKPNSEETDCKHCNHNLRIEDLNSKKIITENKSDDSAPLVRGADIGRYESRPSRHIELDVPGITYKDPSLYDEDKLLVRKTGVGVSADIDYSGSYTTQVVYLFRLQEGAPEPLSLESVLALLNSRAYYFYLTKITGENQWRSHPYLTQTQILNLPLPDADENKDILEEITALIQPHLKEGELPDDVDAKVESLIAKMYGLDKTDYEIIYDTINSSQDLMAINALKNIAVDDIFGEE